MNPLLLLLSILGSGSLMYLSSRNDDDGESAVLSKTPPVTKDGPISKPVGKDEDKDEVTTPPEVVDETPEVVDETPEAPVQTGSTDGIYEGAVTPPADGALDVMAGRVTTISAGGDDVASVRLLSTPEHGTLTVNPDNTFALVLSLSFETGADAFEYEVTHSDGSTSTHKIDLNVTQSLYDSGFANGASTYMLATDEDDRVIVEHGENHVKVYASGSNAAWSLAEIAAAEGMAIEDVTGEWLAENGSYGFSEGMALNDDAAMALWDAVTPKGSVTSNWLLMERGYEYTLGKIIPFKSAGESELHPVYYGAWGEGEKPTLLEKPWGSQGTAENYVFQDIHFASGFSMSGLQNVIIDDCMFTGAGSGLAGNTSGITFRNSDFFDIHRAEPLDSNGDGVWDSKGLSGIFANNTDGLLIEGNLFDHIGWEDDFHADGSIEGGMPPTWFSHNVYIANTSHDVTYRDNISMRSAQDALSLRSSGYLEDNVFLDNNLGYIALGGDWKDAGLIGHYLYSADNLITAASSLKGYLTGALTTGAQDRTYMATHLDNIIAHLADPNDPDGLDGYARTDPALTFTVGDAFYDDTIVWNWKAVTYLDRSEDKNFEGLDQDVLNETTIWNFIGALLGDGNTIDDFAEYLRAEALDLTPDLVDADMILEYFQKGFGLWEADSTQQTARFVPDELGDGVRWDNRINWSTEETPDDGIDVDLGGNHVIFTANSAIGHLDLDTAARLEVHAGKLDVADGISGDDASSLWVSGGGQIWTDGTGGGLDLEVSGGRFVNEGLARHADLEASGGQTVLATGGAAWELDDGHTLSIFGAAAKVGFDSDDGGIAILDAEAGGTFSFAADETGLGQIAEFRTGAMGDAPDVLSGIDLGGATLEIDLAGLNAAAGQSFLLMDADEITGLIDAATSSVGGLGGTLNANIVIDYADDSVRLELTSGTGAVSVTTSGNEGQFDSGEAALWAALTEGHGLADDLPDEEQDYLLDVA